MTARKRRGADLVKAHDATRSRVREKQLQALGREDREGDECSARHGLAAAPPDAAEDEQRDQDSDDG